jgi:hypothetical protein
LVERLNSAVRLELRPGEGVLWQARPFRLVSLHGNTASIRDSVSAELHEVAVADLRGMPSLPPEDFDERVDRLRTASDQSRSLAQQRESIIKELLKREGSMAERLTESIHFLGVRTAQAWALANGKGRGVRAGAFSTASRTTRHQSADLAAAADDE